jgi:hypothetical protein
MPDNYSRGEIRASNREIKARTALSKSNAALKARTAKSYKAGTNKALAKASLKPGHVFGPKGGGGRSYHRDSRGRFA